MLVSISCNIKIIFVILTKYFSRSNVAHYKSFSIGEIGQCHSLFIMLLKLMEIYAEQCDKDSSRDSHRAERLKSYLNEIYVSSILVLNGGAVSGFASPINN